MCVFVFYQLKPFKRNRVVPFIMEQNSNTNSDTISYDLSEPVPAPAPTPTPMDTPIQPDIHIREKEPNPSNSIDYLIRKMVAEQNIKLAILTPCYGSVCHVNYMICLINTIRVLREVGIDVHIEFCKNDSLITRARNNLIAKAMFQKNITHFLFIDSDITWNPVDVVKLLLADRPLVGGIYPVKKYMWDRLIPTNGENVIQNWLNRKNETILKEMDNVEFIQNRLLRYNINHISQTAEIQRNMLEVRHLATGFMMIKRQVIEQMMVAFPYTKYTDDVSYLEPAENEFAYALFDCGVEDDHYLSEDWMFCHRWTKMGGKIYVDVSINLTHTGPEDYRGSFVSSLI